MKNNRTLHRCIGSVMLLFVSLFWIFPAVAAGDDTIGSDSSSLTAIEEKLRDLMDKGDIPGMSLVIVKGDQPVFIKGFGYADVEKKTPVTPDTLFELGSLSKAFTALALLRLDSLGLVNLDAPVSRYMEWFYVTFEGKKTPITLRQLLHHTSGIPQWKSFARIPVSDADDALQQTARNISGMELNRLPGTKYEYVTANYDIIGAVIESITNMSYEDYMTKHVFRPLGLTHTRAGAVKGDPLMATGYKLGYFSMRPFDAPVYRGNNPAGYIVSNGRDMGRWLQIQMGLPDTDTPMAPLVEESHQPDMSVMPVPGPMTSYAMGWTVHKYGSDLIEHGGENPNFTAHMAFRTGEKVGVAVLTNSRNDHTKHIARVVMQHVRGEQPPELFEPGRTLSGTSTTMFVVTSVVLLIIVLYLGSILLDVIRCRRFIHRLTPVKLVQMILTLAALVPFAVAIYLLPLAMRNLPWKVAAVWTPDSFSTAAILILLSMGVGYVSYVLSSMFPLASKFMGSAPMIIVLSLLSGGGNAVVIFLVTSSLFSTMALAYQVYFFLLAFFIYILGRKIIQTRLTHITYRIVYDLRMRLINKIFLTSYQSFEQMERGRVFATLGEDTGQVARVANILAGLVTNFITASCAFVYLFTIAFWAAAVTLVVVAAIATLYYYASGKARAFFEIARDTRNDYMELLNGLLDGYKELRIRYFKRKKYIKEMDDVTHTFSSKMGIANIKFINSFLVGESLLLIVLGSVSFAIPRLFPEITTFTLMSFIMVLLYLIGPVNVILNAIPPITQIRVAWARVARFQRDIPADIERGDIPDMGVERKSVSRIKAKGVTFTYKNENQDKAFSVGPIDFEARKGEITFIIGGNGSGKTTLAKLLTGLYAPDEGYIQIEGKEIDNQYPGEYFSTVFSDYHLFKRLYDVDKDRVQMEGGNYIKLLQLEDKVTVDGEKFSTINLSGGQRKRLALLRCYLENAPIYLFDEVAADQDPEFRKFFYRDLLQRMKKEGKIVIAITHDDHYFDVADRIVKMDMGKIDTLDTSETIRVTR